MIYWTLFLEFFKVGLFTIGGGYAMIPLIKEVVLSYGWMEESVFYDFIGVCESTPGPIAINMATYIGNTNGGILGAICSTLGVILPSVIIITLIAALLKNLTKSKWFKNTVEGIKPVVVGLILSTGVILVAKNLGYVTISEFVFNFKALIIMVILVTIYYVYKVVRKKKFPVIPLILISAVLGIIINLIWNAI